MLQHAYPLHLIKNKKKPWKKKSHILHYFNIQTLISLYRIQQYSQPLCPLCTSIWLLNGGFQTLLPIYTHIHPHTPIQIYPQWYNYSYIPTVAAFFCPPPYQTQPTNLGSTENTMEYQGYGDQVITQRLQDTPKHSLLCWLFS